MKMCLAPCYKGCTDERYAEEAAAVESFLATRGESRLVAVRSARDQASAELAFESAAALHAQVERIESVRALAAELVRPLSQLRAVILQAAAHQDEVAVFLFENGRLRGPAAFSTLGMRIQNEQSGSTSLFAQPMAIEAVPERQGLGTRDLGTSPAQARQRDDEGTRELESKEEEQQRSEIGERESETSDLAHKASGREPHAHQEKLLQDEREVSGHELQTYQEKLQKEHEASGHDLSRAEKGEIEKGALAPAGPPAQAKIPRGLLESRLEATLAELAASASPPSATVRQGHLALLKRWYYRPESRRAGEIFFPDAEDRWPIKAILRGIGRVAAKALDSAARNSQE